MAQAIGSSGDLRLKTDQVWWEKLRVLSFKKIKLCRRCVRFKPEQIVAKLHEIEGKSVTAYLIEKIEMAGKESL